MKSPIPLVEIRCLKCTRFIIEAEIPKGGQYHAYCLGCGTKWTARA